MIAEKVKNFNQASGYSVHNYITLSNQMCDKSPCRNAYNEAGTIGSWTSDLNGDKITAMVNRPQFPQRL
jgi:hypothetical protein